MSGKLFSLIAVVLLPGMALTSVARATVVQNPMIDDLDGGGYNIFDVNDLDVVGDVNVTGIITTADIITKGPWKDVCAYASFSAAIDAIDANETLLIPDSQDVTGDVTVPNNVTLWFLRGGELDISDGNTVTINGPIQAGLHKIFTGAGDVEFGSGYLKEVYPQWWGAVGDGNEDDTDALQAAFDSIADGQKIVIPPGTYKFNDTLTLDNDYAILDCQGMLKWTKETAGTAVLIGGRSGDITAFANAGGSPNKVTVTSASHGLSNGDRVRIVETAHYDKSYYIEDVNTNTFNIIHDWYGDDGTGCWGHSKLGIRAFLRLVHDPRDWSTDANGLQVKNLAYSHITIEKCLGFQRGLHLLSNVTGISYNQFRLDEMTENKIGIDFECVHSGWINQNAFYGGRFGYYSGGDQTSGYAGGRYINIPHYSPNRPYNNIFYSPSFECNNDPNDPNKVEYFVYCDGWHNAIIQPYCEGIPTSGYNVCFDANSSFNVWEAGRPRNIEECLDDGNNNRIETAITKKWGQLTQDANGNITAGGTIEGGSITTTGTIEGEVLKSTGCTATGTKAIAFGYNTQASGNYSTAMGQNTTVFGSCSTAMGYLSIAPGDYSTAMGVIASASGTTSTAVGTAVTAGPASFTTAIGRFYTNNVQDSFAVGYGQKDFSVESGLVTVGDVNINDANLYVTGWISGEDLIDRSSFYDKDNYGKALDYLVDSSRTIRLNAEGEKEYNHEADPEFVQRWITLKDYDKYTEEEVWDELLNKTITRRIYQTRQELGSSVTMKLSWLTQCVFELKQENQMLKDEIARLKEVVGIE